jgi:hypothetical protein
MIKSKNKIYSFFEVTFIFSLFSLIVFYFAKEYGLNRHWAAFPDHEVTYAYNALLFNSAIEHEQTDHSGYFSILFLSIFFKILNLFGYLSTFKFSILNNNNNYETDFQNIIFFTRIYSSITIAILYTLVFYFLNYFAKNKLYSFLLSLIIFSTLSNFVHLSKLRTEIVTEIFFILSFFNLILFFKRENQFRIYNIIFFFLFLYCSILNKSQALFYLPYILLLTYFYVEQMKDFNLENFKFIESKNFKIILIFIYMAYLSIKFLSEYNPTILSPFFLILNILMINLFFYICLKRFNLSIEKNLVFINFLLILIFLLFKSFLFIHPSTSELAFEKTFTNIIGAVIGLTASDQTNLVSKFFLLFNKNINDNLFAFTYHSFLLFTYLLLNLIFLKKLKKKDTIFNLCCVLSFVIISTINEIKDNYYYEIFADLFLIIAFCNFGIFFKKFKIILFLPILLINLYINYYPNINYIEEVKLSGKNFDGIKWLCAPDQNYLFVYHKNLNFDNFQQICKKY